MKFCVSNFPIENSLKIVIFKVTLSWKNRTDHFNVRNIREWSEVLVVAIELNSSISGLTIKFVIFKVVLFEQS